jgi:signal transduction histidine kinase
MVLLVAPKGRDAELAAGTLERGGLSVTVARDLVEIAHHFSDETDALLIAEEALLPTQLPGLLNKLKRQPPWSDIPVIILTAPRGGDRASAQALEIFGPAANVSLLERPLRMVTMVAAVKAAMRARRRQRQVRELIVEREAVLGNISRAKVEAEKANRAKDQFLAMLSHELRTPLTPVLMMVSELQNDSRLPEDVRSDLETLRRNIELEALLIDDLLDLTRIAHGKLKLHKAPIDLHASLAHALAISSMELKEKTIAVRQNLKARRHHALADAARMEQVFWNIIKNAVKFTPAGGELRIATRNENGLIVVDFADTGIGIGPELLPRIFDAFEQGGRASTSRHGGLGLGLAICKRVIEIHGGHISVQSEGPNRGATFTVRLKAIPATAVKQLPVIESVTTNQPADILLVEDHADTAKIMQRILEKTGYRVQHASDVASAKELAQKFRFQLVISDVGLPDGDGLQLMRDLRDTHQLKGIALSGFGMDTDVDAARRAGFVDHLTKPVDPDHLREVIERRLAE